ncbi:MAG: PAS domain-containing protein [Pseudomonadota bacterium]
MKINLPVTQREVPYPKGHYLVSRTDLKGLITDANETFVEISGFTRQELIGKSHNIVRHPDMPPQAFEDLWSTVKSGKPWNGLVKNRTKNGDYYWVNAFVIPVRKNGAIEGYMSVRSEPKRADVQQAEARYRALLQSSKPIPRPGKIRKLLNIRTRLAATMSVSALLVVLGAVIGLHGIQSSNAALQAAYRDHFEPVLEARKSLHLMDGAFKHVALALEHSPDNRFSKSHDHPIGKHTDDIGKKNRRHERAACEVAATRSRPG